jgi:hypothetical protein
MKTAMKRLLVVAALTFSAGAAWADKYDEAIANFKTSGKVASFFDKS